MYCGFNSFLREFTQLNAIKHTGLELFVLYVFNLHLLGLKLGKWLQSCIFIIILFLII